MKCAICMGQIEVVGTWTEGNNAEPVVEDGRCCDSCNADIVIPVRCKRSANVKAVGRAQ